MNPVTIEVSPNILKRENSRWVLDAPMAKTGGGLFTISAPWCKHCSELKKEVSKAQKIVPFDFFDMQGDKTESHKQKMKELGVNGFPTMFYVGKAGVLFPYTGDRSASALSEVFSRRN